MRTVVDSDYRWEFGDYATVSVIKEVADLRKGKSSHSCKIDYCTVTYAIPD